MCKVGVTAVTATLDFCEGEEHNVHKSIQCQADMKQSTYCLVVRFSAYMVMLFLILLFLPGGRKIP